MGEAGWADLSSNGSRSYLGRTNGPWFYSNHHFSNATLRKCGPTHRVRPIFPPLALDNEWRDPRFSTTNIKVPKHFYCFKFDAIGVTPNTKL